MSNGEIVRALLRDRTGKDPLFDLGQCVMTPGAERLLHREGISALALLGRHAFGDWGDVAREDQGLNDESLKDGSRLLSVYKLPNTGQTIWLITEAADDDGHRHATTALLPDEY